MRIELKNLECKFCHSDKIEMVVYSEPKEISLICSKCGITQTVLEYKKESTESDLYEVQNVDFVEITQKKINLKIAKKKNFL